MNEWHSGYVKANGINIHYHRTGGAKPALLLLHGITDNGLCWTRFARDLEQRYDIIMPDARGHGSSKGVSSGFTEVILADDAAGVITALGLERPFVFGHSMGAATAARLAAGYPELVRAILLEDPPYAEVTPLTGQGMRLFRQEIITLKGLPSPQRIARISAENPGWHALEIGATAQAKAEVDLEIFERIDDLHAGPPWYEVLPRIQCPGLLLTGDPAAGAIITPEVAQRAAGLWRNLKVARILGAGHCIHRDRYAESLQAVRDFLESQETSPENKTS